MSDINVQTFSGKVNISNNLKVGQGHLFVDTLNNQVGLNTNTPAAGLHVNGNTFVNTDLRVGTKVLIDSGATDSNVIEVTNGNIKAEFLHGDGSNITSISADNIDGTLSQWTGAVGSSISYAENVGIGLTNPQFKLDVNGDANVGVLTATFLHGDGSNIANIVSSQWEGSPGDPIYYDGNVGIATTSAPTRTLEVGSNLYVEDAGSNVLVVDGNVAVDSISVGDFTIVASQGLDHVTNENNTTAQVVQFNHPTTGFITAANAVIGGTLSLQNFALSQSYGLENVPDVNNTTGDTIVSSNATTGFQSTANVSVGRDALVTGNVTVGKDLTVTEEAAFSSNVTIAKDLEVSGNVTNLDVLSNVNLLSVSNVVSIKKDSNVVAEFPRSKKLIKYPRVALSTNAGNHSALGSGYTQDGYTVKVSSELTTTLTGTKAFTNTNLDNADTWISDQLKYSSGIPVSNTTNVNKFGQNGEWLEIKLPNKIKLSSTRIFSRRTYVTERNDTADIWASNTGTDGDWVKLTTINFNDTYTDVIPMVAEIDTQNYYSYFAIQITEVGWNGGTYVNIGEWELFGLPEYDPDAAGMDVKVTSYPNVPNTDWLEVYYDAKESSSYPGTGGTVVDLSGNGNNGTLTNVTVSDGAFVFNGTSSLLESSTTITNSTGDIPHTFSLWVKPSDGDLDDTGNHYLIAYGTELNTGKWSGISISNKRFASVIHASVVRIGPEIRVGEWYHIVLNYKSGGIHNSDRFDFFINGSRINTSALSTAGSQAGSATLNLSSPAKLVLGGLFNGSERSSSTIANTRLFNRVLTQDEVWQLYAYQKEYFGHGDLGMTLKAGRLGVGTSEPRVALDVRGGIHANGGQSWPIPCAIFSNVTPSNTGSTYYENNIGTTQVNYNKISLEDPSGTIQASVGSPNITLNRIGMYEFHTESSLKLQSGAGSSHIGHAIIGAGVSGSGFFFEANGYELITTTYNILKLVNRTSKVLVTSAPYVVKYQLQPIANYTDRFTELAYGNNNEIHTVAVKYLG